MKDNVNPLDGRLIIPTSWRISGPDAQDPGSVGVIADAAAEINDFVRRQREFLAVSPGLAQHRGRYTSPSLDIDFHSNQGEERVILTPRVFVLVVELDQPAETPDQPIDVLVPVIELPTLYLLVLYLKNKLAAFRMDSLGVSQSSGDVAAILDYQTSLSSSDGDTDGFGELPIYVHQTTFASQSVILTGCDFTGKSDGTKLCLCTTALNDATPTTSDNTTIPVMNGTPATQPGQGAGSSDVTVWTMAQSFSYQPGSGGQPGSFAADATASLKPYAIDSDGTSYYPGNTVGPASLTVIGLVDMMDGTESGALDVTATFDKQMPTASAHYNYTSGTNHDISGRITVQSFGNKDPAFGIFGQYDNEVYTTFDSTSDQTMFDIGLGGQALMDEPIAVSEAIGFSFYGQGSYGAVPTSFNGNVAITGKLYTHYDPEQNLDTLKLSTKQLNDYSGSVVYTLFDQENYTLVTQKDAITATLKTDPNFVAGPAKVPPPNETLDTLTPTIAGSTVIEASTTKFDPPGQQFTTNGTETTSIGATCFVYLAATKTKAAMMAFPAGQTFTAEAARSKMQSLFADVGPDVTFSTDVEGTRTVVTTGQGSGLAAHFDLDTKATGSFAPGFITPPNKPVQFPGTQTPSIINDITGELTWGQVSIKQGQTIALYPFPPALKQQPTYVGVGTSLLWYSVCAGSVETQQSVGDQAVASSSSAAAGSDPKGMVAPYNVAVAYTLPGGSDASGKQQGTAPQVVTPYGPFSDNLTPWLHLANRQHCIQGFCIGAVPAPETMNAGVTSPAGKDMRKRYLFCDGGDLMKSLLAVLSTDEAPVKDSDIQACYIDVALSTIQGLSKITSKAPKPVNVS